MSFLWPWNFSTLFLLSTKLFSLNFTYKTKLFKENVYLLIDLQVKTWKQLAESEANWNDPYKDKSSKNKDSFWINNSKMFFLTIKKAMWSTGNYFWHVNFTQKNTYVIRQNRFFTFGKYDQCVDVVKASSPVPLNICSSTFIEPLFGAKYSERQSNNSAEKWHFCYRSLPAVRNIVQHKPYQLTACRFL